MTKYKRKRLEQNAIKHCNYDSAGIFQEYRIDTSAPALHPT